MSGVAGVVTGISAASAVNNVMGDNDNKKDSSFFPSFKDWFSPKGGLALEEVKVHINEDMNNHGAVKAHLVIVYDPELLGILRKKRADQYFDCLDQLKKDYPNTMKIFEWELIAKERVIPWKKIKYTANHNVPLGGYIFAKYSQNFEKPKDYRAKIPPTHKKIKITFKRDDFHLAREDYDDDTIADQQQESPSSFSSSQQQEKEKDRPHEGTLLDFTLF
ncbi:MAG: hypothetical protein LBO73_00635 [Holosporaceae bacterium]|nr:hypothetical protein [Holosporaceae bacterium]